VSGDPADLDELDDADPSLLRALFARLPGEVWSTALMGASAAFRVRLLSALPAADAAALRQSLTRQRPARLRDIETAQQRVLDLLHESGAFASAR
jgi:flagellar motor switch protein FliG